MATEETKTDAVQAGVPFSDFEAAVDVLQALQREGKYQVFLARPNSVRLIGDSDQFRISLAKRLPGTLVEAKHAGGLLEEIRMILQLLVVFEKVAQAARILEEAVFRDEFKSANKDPDIQRGLRATIFKKAQIVFDKLMSDTMRERGRRLSTIVGPLLEDLDFELVTSRRCSAESSRISSPFLRLRLRYSLGGRQPSMFFAPPWLNGPVDTDGFELECDLTDIDLLVARLLEAKELLREAAGLQNKAIEAKIQPEKT